MAEQIITKRCSKCKEIKPLSEFYSDHSHKDGFRSHCKICHCKKMIQYAKTPKGKISQNRYHQSDKGRKVVAFHKLKYRAKYPERFKVRSIVSNAVKLGKLQKARLLQCYYCGKLAQEYHHHNGYDVKYPFDVVPVCKKCHTALSLSKTMAAI